MRSIPIEPGAADRPSDTAPPRISGVGAWLALLVAACGAGIAVTALVGDPGPMLRADPELARLLRGMASIKAMVAVAAVAAIAWRIGRSTSASIAPATAGGYCVGAALMAGASALVWQLSSLRVAAVVFHAGLLLVLVVAWHDDTPLAHRGRRFGAFRRTARAP